jgi:hypothetical protein
MISVARLRPPTRRTRFSPTPRTRYSTRVVGALFSAKNSRARSARRGGTGVRLAENRGQAVETAQPGRAGGCAFNENMHNAVPMPIKKSVVPRVRLSIGGG